MYFCLQVSWSIGDRGRTGLHGLLLLVLITGKSGRGDTVMASLEKPVEEGKEYEVEIEDLSRRGDGLAKIEGFIIFIPDTKPGDRVNIRVTQVRDRFAVAEKI